MNKKTMIPILTNALERGDFKLNNEDSRSTFQERHLEAQTQYLEGIMRALLEFATQDEPENECAKKECSYYSHYLVYYDPGVNGPKLEHEAYHFVEVRCAEAQKAIAKWMDEHELSEDVPPHLVRPAEFWEKKAAA